MARFRCAREVIIPSSGTKLGPNEILAQLRAGGMGEVYRARDEKLNRDVAIKVLPAAAEINHHGKELFFLSPERKLMAVPVKGGATLESGVPVPLFQTRVPPSNFTGARNNYVVAATVSGSWSPMSPGTLLRLSRWC